MRAIQKKRLNKSQRLAVILSIVLAALIAVLIVLTVVLPLALANKNNGNTTGSTSIKSEYGESSYLGALTAYPRVEPSKISAILVKNENGSFDMTRVSKNGTFWLGYTVPTEDGETVWEQYIPPIMEAENGISYSELYAIETTDGYGTIPLLTYLCNAIGLPYFTQRIEFNQDKNGDGFADADTDRDGVVSEAEEEALLSVYGLGSDNPNRISFSYLTGVADIVVVAVGEEKALEVDLGEDGEYAIGDTGVVVVVENKEVYIKSSGCSDGKCLEADRITKNGASIKCEELGVTVTITEKGKTHHIETGSHALNGQGYYFRVDGRDCVYYTNTSSLSYGLLGFHKFIKGTVIAPGLPSDYSYEPLLTTGFESWKNTYHETGSVVDGANVIIKGDVLTSIKESVDFKPDSGYKVTTGSELTFDLTDLKSLLDDKGKTTDNYDILRDALVGLSVGKKDEPVYVTLLKSVSETDGMLIDFGDKESVTYTYTVTAIESIIDRYVDGAMKECVATGTPVGDEPTLIRVTYDYKIDGESVNTVPCHAVIDLTSTLLDASAVAALRASGVGELVTPITFDVEYTKDNAPASTEEFVVTDIVGIFNKSGSQISEVTEDSYVAIRFTHKVNGKVGENTSRTVLVSELRKDEKLAPLADMLIGRERGEGVNIVAYSKTYYREALQEFETYVIRDVKAFVTSELVVSFAFQNPSDRDPFYGESIYENLTDGRLLYGLNANVCESAIRRLGGLTSGSSTQSYGLSGETVAVGLTHEVMEEYGLYAYEVYFELPRDIYDSTSSNVSDDDSDGSLADELNDWAWHGTLGFRLYVCDSHDEEHLKSGKHTAGKRCVGSEMYNIVAQVDESAFEFLAYGFVDFWARRSLLMIDIYDIEEFKIEFSMEDVYGSYDFDIVNSIAYVGLYNGKYTTSTQPFTTDSGAEANKVDYFKIYATEGLGSMKSGLSTYLEATYGSNYQATGNNKGSIAKMYDMIMGGGEQLFVPNSIETVGASNFMLALEIMQYTHYTGTLTEEEQEKGFLDNNKCMTLKLKLDGENKNASAYYYVYDFYRISGGKVMVATYQVDRDGDRVSGVVSDFYLSNATFKKIVYGYLSLLNAEDVRYDVAYPDEVN